MVLEHKDGDTLTQSSLNFDVLLLATGSTYNSPWRAHDEHIPTTAERENEWKKVREDINAASSVLVVGGGPAGVEAAGWIKEVHPEKTVGIAMRGQTLLTRFNNAHAVAENILKEIGVEMHYNRTWNKGDSVADFAYVLDCRGFRFNGPALYLKGDMAECVDRKTS